MGIHVHRSERTDCLLLGLAHLLTNTPADPFTPEIVAVPTPGIERFITQGLGLILGTSDDGDDGVCANVQFPSPSTIVNRVVSQVGGIDPRDDPWLPHKAVWPLLAVIDRSAQEAWCEPLARHLGLLDDDPARRDRRFAVAGRLSSLFATYASQRPQLLLDWAVGLDSDGAGGSVPADLSWQPPLWRALRDEIGLASTAERMTQTSRALQNDPSLADLPDRLSLFGPSRLPTDQLQILAALGVGREVHLWLADASPALWQTQDRGQSQRSDDTSDVANPLLRSLGRDSREMRSRLTHQLPIESDEHIPAALESGTLLGRLQCHLRDNLDPLHEPPADLAGDDRSISVHACHGATRQAEVVREILLGLLQADPTLEPRDILIMCPDLETFAPLLSAAFSRTDTTGGLRLRIADRTPEQSNTVLAALAALLDLVTGRLELSTLLDFAALPPVRTKFGFDDDGLERLAVLTSHASIRWGLDDAHRAEYRVAVAAGTWSWGLDRLLLGVAMSEDGLALLDGVLPVDDVNSGDVSLVGRLAELVSRLQSIRDTLHNSHLICDWVEILGDALTDLTEVRGIDAWQLPNAVGAIAGLSDDASRTALTLADMRWLLAEVLQGKPTRSNFRSGDLTVCGLVPMRSVPHRVICLVGMDDGAFPRTGHSNGDDVLARDPLVGERDIRNEDRQVLLDALMAAEEHLVITYTGADERTNEPRPPCVPLGDLLDTLETMAPGARAHVRVEHPLQPFDWRNFARGALCGPGPFSHDESALATARRAMQPRTRAPSLLVADLPPMQIPHVSLQELGTFLTSPPAAFIRTRLGLSLWTEEEPASERIPISVDHLQQWKIGNRALRLLIRGEPVTAVATAERARGDLPPGALGAGTLRQVGEAASKLTERFMDAKSGDPRQVPVSIESPDGLRVFGTVADVFHEGIVRATFSKAKPKDEVRVWPQLLALAVARPDRRWAATLISKDTGVRLTAPPAAEAWEILTGLAELYVCGMQSPLPLPIAAACSYSKRRREGKTVQQAIAAVRFGVWRRDHSEREQPEFEMLWGVNADFDVILAEPPGPDENWLDEDSRFGMLARRVWDPVLHAREPL